ncbi:MAG: hypothetical protein H7338_17025, partial [Candidatus Sericytochromatia bacterium]|nr:hypothetical protein [Candidatus Sericytochromatia bacterium]
WLNHEPWIASSGFWQLPAFSSYQYGFRRYAGAAFGADGRTPDLYQVTYRIKPAAGANQIAVLPYYLDPTHYMMVMLNLTNRNVSLWQFDGGTPTSGSTGTTDVSQNFRGWRPLPAPAADGSYMIRVKVNAVWHSLAVWVGGTWIDTPYLPAVNQQPHTIGIRANGAPQGVVSVDVLRYDTPEQAR